MLNTCFVKHYEMIGTITEAACGASQPDSQHHRVASAHLAVSVTQGANVIFP